MRLRNLFTDDEVREADESTDSYSAMAEKLSALGRGYVSRQLALYWSRQFDQTKRNGDYYLTLTQANRELKKKRAIRSPHPSDQLAIEEQGTDASRILFVTDFHAPYHHPDAINFLQEVISQYIPTMIICGGDEVDAHALSFHNSDPNLDAAGRELEMAQEFLDELHDLFDDMRICQSNHGSLHYRRAKAHGIPIEYMKTYRDILFPSGGAEGWSWHEQIRIEMPYGRDLQFQHQANGDVMKNAAYEGANLYVGHEHSKFGIGYAANAIETFHSVYGGCLVDKDSMAYAYGKNFLAKPVLGCVMIHQGVPMCIPMQVDNHNRWTGRM